MNHPIRVPELGTTEAILTCWFVRPGDHVHEGDRLVELLLGAMTFDISSPVSGVIIERWALVDHRVKIGQILGMVAADDPIF